jgi:hypothetical protein
MTFMCDGKLTSAPSTPQSGAEISELITCGG